MTFTVDLTAPALEITYPTDNGIYAVAAITGEWSATDDSSGLLGYGYRIDGGQWSVLSMTDSHTYSSLGEGLHTLDVYAMDNVLNNATASVTFMVDTVQPSISITSPTIDQIFNQSSVVATWAGDDVTSQIAGYYYRMDSEAWSDLTSDTSHTFPGLGEGYHTVTVGAQDNAGNVRYASVSFMVDTIAPSVSINLPADHAVINNTDVSWSGSDATSGILGYQYRVDGGAWSVTSLDVAHTFIGLDDGTHGVDVLAWDIAGNSALAYVDFTLDTLAPTIFFDLPLDRILLNSSDVNVDWHAEDATSGVHGYSYRLDSGAWSGVSPTSDHLFTDLVEGLHTVTVRAYDNVNLLSISTVTFTVDTVDPTLTIDAPNDGSLISIDSATVSWTAGDVMSGIQGTQFMLDGAVWSPLSGTVTHTFAGLPEGHHILVVRAYDWANNTFNASIGFTIDTVAPELTIGYPADEAIINSSSLQVEWEGGDATSGIAGYQCRIDGGDWSGLSMDLNGTFDNMIDGPHTVNVRATDVAGHYTVRSVNFTVDTVPPVLAITSPTNGTYWNTPTVRITWTSSDATTSVFDYRIRVGSGSWVSGITDLFANVTFTGNQTVILQARDLAGNVQQAVVYFTIDTEAPTLSIINPVEGYFLNVSWVNLTWSGTDAISAIGSYQVLIDGGNWSEMQSASFRNITGLADGPHTAQVKAIDLAGNEIVVSVSFIVDTTAPTVEIIAPSEGHYSQSPSVSVTWSGDDIGVGVQAYQYRVNGGTWSSMTTETGHTFDLPEGVNTVEVRIYDWANNTANVSVGFTVDTTVPEVEITAPVNGLFSNSSTVNVNWTGSDATTSIQGYQYRVNGGQWSSLSSETNVMLDLEDGNYTVEVRAYDMAGNNATTSIAFTVDTVAPIPVFVSPSRDINTNITSISISWTATDITSGVHNYSFRLDGGAWAPMEMANGITVSELADGRHRMDVMATDRAGNSAMVSVNVTVDTVSPHVEILSPDNGVNTNSTTMTVHWTGSDGTTGIAGYLYCIDGGTGPRCRWRCSAPSADLMTGSIPSRSRPWTTPTIRPRYPSRSPSTRSRRSWSYHHRMTDGSPSTPPWRSDGTPSMPPQECWASSIASTGACGRRPAVTPDAPSESFRKVRT